MITQEFADKTGLLITDIHNGRAFINNVTVCEWPAMNTHERKVYVSDGDVGGEPLGNNMFMVYARYKIGDNKYWASYLLPSSILEYAPEEAMKLSEVQFQNIINRVADAAER